MGLYIHVPFCGSICSYCHFARTAAHDPALRARYVEGVLSELALRRNDCSTLGHPGRNLQTAYLGGGTPSELAAPLMERLLTGVLTDFSLAADFELTAEANPESLTADLAAAWRQQGINRVSLGVQSLDPTVLKLLGRQCEPATARTALDVACRTFERVSADWIIGPGLERGPLLDELTEAAERGVEHFSVYILELHQGTKLETLVADQKVRLLPDHKTEELYLAVIEHLASLGVVQYEVANFARPGAESRHNSNYWRHQPWLGLGPGAHGYWGRRRAANHDDVRKWLGDVENGIIPEAEVDILDRSALRLERLILGLRTRAGVPLNRLPANALDLRRGQSEGLWQIIDQRLVLTSRGFLRIDSIEERLAMGLDKVDTLNSH